MLSRHLMVVDDDLIYLDMIAEALSDKGYRVTTCVGGDQTLELIARVRPALLLLDVHLYQNYSGWSLLRRLRANSPTANLPVLICSTDPQLLNDNAQWLQSQGCDVLEKPFILSELEAKVDAMMCVSLEI